jgi:hypothetical protein
VLWKNSMPHGLENGLRWKQCFMTKMLRSELNLQLLNLGW